MVSPEQLVQPSTPVSCEHRMMEGVNHSKLQEVAWCLPHSQPLMAYSQPLMAHSQPLMAHSQPLVAHFQAFPHSQTVVQAITDISLIPQTAMQPLHVGTRLGTWLAGYE